MILENSTPDIYATRGKLIASIVEKYSEGLHELKKVLDEAASNLNFGVKLLVSRDDEVYSEVGANARDLLRNHHKVACFYFRYAGYDVEDHYNALGKVDGYVISWNNEKGW